MEKGNIRYNYLENIPSIFPTGVLDHFEKIHYCLLIWAKSFLRKGTTDDELWKW